jgi:hypothetical protein
MPFPRLTKDFAHFNSFSIKNKFVDTFKNFTFSKAMASTISGPKPLYQGWIGGVLSVYLAVFHQVFSKIINFIEKSDFFLVGGSNNCMLIAA